MSLRKSIFVLVTVCAGLFYQPVNAAESVGLLGSTLREHAREIHRASERMVAQAEAYKGYYDSDNFHVVYQLRDLESSARRFRSRVDSWLQDPSLAYNEFYDVAGDLEDVKMVASRATFFRFIMDDLNRASESVRELRLYYYGYGYRHWDDHYRDDRERRRHEERERRERERRDRWDRDGHRYDRDRHERERRDRERWDRDRRDREERDRNERERRERERREREDRERRDRDNRDRDRWDRDRDRDRGDRDRRDREDRERRDRNRHR